LVFRGGFQVVVTTFREGFFETIDDFGEDVVEEKETTGSSDVLIGIV